MLVSLRAGHHVFINSHRGDRAFHGDGGSEHYSSEFHDGIKLLCQDSQYNQQFYTSFTSLACLHILFWILQIDMVHCLVDHIILHSYETCYSNRAYIVVTEHILRVYNMLEIFFFIITLCHIYFLPLINIIAICVSTIIISLFITNYPFINWHQCQQIHLPYCQKYPPLVLMETIFFSPPLTSREKGWMTPPKFDQFLLYLFT